MKLHSVFLRSGSTLPDGLDLALGPFSDEWNAMEMSAVDLDVEIRRAGWHFIWLQGEYARRGCGRTREGAIHRAIGHALGKIAKQFNGAELESVKVSRYPGFHCASATVSVRQIQRQAAMEMSGA